MLDIPLAYFWRRIKAKTMVRTRERRSCGTSGGLSIVRGDARVKLLLSLHLSSTTLHQLTTSLNLE